MTRHRVFNADRFLDKLQDFEQLLRDFVGLWEERLEIDSSGLDVPGLKRWLVEGTGEAKDELLEALYQVYDLCTERGHEDLLAAIGEDPTYVPAPGQRLPVKCLALKLRTEREDLFFLAYDRYTLWRAERFTIYRGLVPRPIEDLPAAARAFQQELSTVFKDHKHSDRVLLRHHEEDTQARRVTTNTRIERLLGARSFT